MRKLWVITIFLSGWAAAGEDGDPARRNGPTIRDMARKASISPHELLAEMFLAMETLWIVPAYAQAGSVDFRAHVDAHLPLAAVDRRGPAGESIAFRLDVDGLAAPNGRHRLEVQGDLGEVELVDDLRRHLISSRNFKSFADTPHAGRKSNANLTNYRSYLLRYLGKMKAQLLQSGAYRSVYAGTGSYDGGEVHVVRVYKPGRKRANPKAPMALRRLWTFWHDGGYEIWLHRASKLPAVVFYTNVDDNIFANFSIDYDANWLPTRLSFQNNSVGSTGGGDVVFQFDSQRILSGISLKFDGENGVSIRLDATLLFGSEPAAVAFRVIPPFGFKKVNRDHLKLMLMTQVTGGLLKLKKYGVNLKNLKF